MSADFTPLISHRKDKAFEVYDLETTPDLQRTYLAGWYNGSEFKCWESALLPPEHPDSAVSRFCMWLFGRKKCPPLYAHNGGNFDHLYILKWLLVHMPTARIELIPTQSSILLMTVHIGRQKFEFRDSMRLMVAGLDDIAKTLLGQGKVEGIDYSTLHADPRRYDYLQRDCVALYECLIKFRSIVTDRLGGSVGLTAAATAINTLRERFLNRPIKGLSAPQEELVRRAYYGGRTEVFHKGMVFSPPNFLRCYDVNSMYVWALAEELPVDISGETTGKWLDCDGFLECEVDTSGCSGIARQYPVLPYRRAGKLLFPLGRFRGVWPTAELRLAIGCGYRLTWIGRGLWFSFASVFSNYVATLYKMRDKSLPDYDPTLSAIAKVLGNATYGKFGTNRERERLHVRPAMDNILTHSMRQLQGPLELPVYVEECQSEASYILPHLAAWVTSLARTKLLRYIHGCGPWRVYYCDTDSIYTCAPLSTGGALGQLKEEHSAIIKAEFIAPKVYRLTHQDNHVTTRAKGFSEFAKGFAGDFDALASGAPMQCSAMSKLRTVLRGDFGLIVHRKHLLYEGVKREFLPDGSSVPLTITDEEDNEAGKQRKQTHQ